MSSELLTLPPEQTRQLGYRVVDAFVSHLAHEDDRPSLPVPVSDLLAGLDGSCPDGPSDPASVLSTAIDLMRYGNHPDHPRNFALVPSPSNAMGVLGDMVAVAMNAGAMSASGHPAATALEITVIRWLATLLGLPEDTDGVLLSGGSMSSLTALAVARSEMLGAGGRHGVAYVTDQTHASILRALRILGLGPDNVRILPTGARFRMDAHELDTAISRDLTAGLQPFCVVATAGTTNTGAIDPLVEIAEVAHERGLWLHVDGAYGAAAALTERGRRALVGLERADSLAIDPHKWLFVPYELGTLFVRRSGALERTFAMSPEYLRDTTRPLGGAGVDFRDRGPQLTRAARALKLWMTFKTFGAREIRAGVLHGMRLAEHAEAELRKSDEWHVVTPAQLGVVTFAHESAAARDVVAGARADGFCELSSTILAGKEVLRLCTLNPRTTEEDVSEALARLTALVSAGACGS